MSYLTAALIYGAMTTFLLIALGFFIGVLCERRRFKNELVNRGIIE